MGRTKELFGFSEIEKERYLDDEAHEASLSNSEDEWNWDEIEIGQLALEDGKEVEVNGDRKTIRVVK